MAHLLLPAASAFLAAPCVWGKRDARPESGSTPPLVFVVFCVACAALTAVEALFPPASAAAQAVETVFVPLL